MMKSKTFTLAAAIAAAATGLTFALCGCQYRTDNSDRWKTEFDISTPDFSDVGTGADSANASGWYLTMNEEFESELNGGLGEYFYPESHGLRKEEYWCDDEVSVKDGKAVINAERSSDHRCAAGICPEEGLFTGGISTSKFVDGKRVPTFEQAFGYFEATVKFPDADGMWSAFWLQCDSMGQIGNDGRDGSEIDVYESGFYRNRTKVGHCIHWDGYGNDHRAGQSVRDAGYDLYEGYHTFGLKWTPEEYVFYVDGVANWATDFGGISRVPQYIKLTNEIRPNTTGPYGQKLKEFVGGVFYIESVRVYQNVNYLDEIRFAADFL